MTAIIHSGVIKPPFQWFGSKRRHVRCLLQYFPPPSEQTKHFVDCCGGGGAVALNCPDYAKVTYNDIYGELVNFFRVLRGRETSGRLIEQLELTPYARAEWELAQERGHPDLIERARRFWVRVNQSFQGLEQRDQWGVSINDHCFPDGGARLRARCNARAIALLPYIAPLLQHWHLENRDVFKLIDFYDTPTTLFYVDPPYVAEQRSSGQGKQYTHEASDWQWHKRLAAKLQTIVGKAIVSSYASDRYAALYEGWRRVDGEPYKSNSLPPKIKQEMLLINFPETEQAQSNLI